MSDKMYDVIIVGASAEGVELCDYLRTKAGNLSIAFISKNFDNATKYDFSGIDLIKGEAVVSSYNHGLIGFQLKNRVSVFGKAAVIATGSRPAKLTTFKSNNLYYKPSEITEPAKNKQAVVYGNGEDAIKYALEISKKFKYIYLCSNTFDLTSNQKLIKKLDNVANILHLPSCNIVSIKNDKTGNLQEVTLDTYDTIRCAALVLALGRAPDVSGISKKMLEVDADGFAVTKEFNESTKVPSIYVVGACAKKNTKQSIHAVGNKIIERRQ